MSTIWEGVYPNGSVQDCSISIANMAVKYERWKCMISASFVWWWEYRTNLDYEISTGIKLNN